MPSLSEFNMYFDGARGWFGPSGPVSLDVSRLISVDRRSLMTALVSRFGKRAFTCVIFVDWSGSIYEGPYAGRRFGGYFMPMREAPMWTERHMAACRHGKYADYVQIHTRGYPTVALEVSPNADDQWQLGERPTIRFTTPPAPNSGSSATNLPAPRQSGQQHLHKVKPRCYRRGSL